MNWPNNTKTRERLSISRFNTAHTSSSILSTVEQSLFPVVFWLFPLVKKRRRSKWPPLFLPDLSPHPPFSFFLFIFFFIFFLVKGKYEINSRDKFVVNCGKGHVSFMKRCVLRTEKGGISTKWKACVKFHARKFKSRVSRWNLSCVVFRYQCIYLRIVYRRVFCYDESNDAVMGLLINYRLIDNL